MDCVYGDSCGPREPTSTEQMCFLNVPVFTGGVGIQKSVISRYQQAVISAEIIVVSVNESSRWHCASTRTTGLTQRRRDGEAQRDVAGNQKAAK
jgi:hypothetical protein